MHHRHHGGCNCGGHHGEYGGGCQCGRHGGGGGCDCGGHHGGRDSCQCGHHAGAGCACGGHGGGDCACEHGHRGGHEFGRGRDFRRRFFSRDEVLQQLEGYAAALEAEANAVRERLAELRGEAAPSAEAEEEGC